MLSVIMLNVIMLNIIMLNVIMLTVIMLYDIMLNVIMLIGMEPCVASRSKSISRVLNLAQVLSCQLKFVHAQAPGFTWVTLFEL